jgi:hypothetical protein
MTFLPLKNTVSWSPFTSSAMVCQFRALAVDEVVKADVLVHGVAARDVVVFFIDGAGNHAEGAITVAADALAGDLDAHVGVTASGRQHAGIAVVGLVIVALHQHLSATRRIGDFFHQPLGRSAWSDGVDGETGGCLIDGIAVKGGGDGSGRQR